jgi:hypothetical protein
VQVARTLQYRVVVGFYIYFYKAAMSSDTDSSAAVEDASYREDLEDQLRRQEEVHRQLRDQILQEREQLDEFKELLTQLQKNGRFVDPVASLGAIEFGIGDTEDESLATENRNESRTNRSTH